jgi:protein-tyrosine-phosphatase
VFYVALGYFISYLSYALLAKGIFCGVVPGIDWPAGGLVLLPAAVLGQRLAMPIFLGVAGGDTVVGAVVALSYPALRNSLPRTAPPPERMMLFVREGNLSRSNMATCIAPAAMVAARSGHLMTIASPGITVHTPASPMTEAANAVFQEVGTIRHRHRSRPLTAVLVLAPEMADRAHCLAGSDIPGPAAASLDDHRHTAVLIQQAVQKRLAEKFL